MPTDLNDVQKKRLIHMILPVMGGGLIYLFFHKPNLLLHEYIYKLVKIPNYYSYFQQNKFYLLCLNHLPDALWIYSFAIFLCISFEPIKNKILKATIIIFLGSCSELVQLFTPKQFTFDRIDLILTLTIITLIYYNYEIKKNI